MKELVLLVLAGGIGTRFWPLHGDKLSFPFLGHPFSYYTFEQEIPSSISRMVIITSPTNDTYFQKQKYSIPHSTIIQPSAKGMADAVLASALQLKNCRLMIVIADDLLNDQFLGEVIKKAEMSQAFGIIPARSVSSYFPGGYLSLEGEKVTGIIEKPDPGTEPSTFVNISGHYFSDSSILLEELERLSSGNEDDRYEQAVSNLIQKYTFEIYRYEGQFSSLKYPWHVLTVMDELLQQVKPFRGADVIIKNNVFIEGAVHIGNNVKIFENTKIVGPVYIGDNTIIGNNNVIRDSMIGEHCVTGFNTDITRSYIGDSCWFHSNYIGDSVIEQNVSLGSGSVLANLRLDEGDIFASVKGEKVKTHRNKLGAIIGSDVRIGVNTSIMPGVKIGKNSFIGAGITVAEDISDSSFVYGKTELVIEKNVKTIEKDRENFRKKI